MSEHISIQQKIQQYRQLNPTLNDLSDEQILSIMSKNGEITLTKEQKISLYSSKTNTSNNHKGVEIEKQTDTKTIMLQSGEKIVISSGIPKYYSTDGKELNQKDFEQHVGIIDVRNSGRYSITKNGKTRYYAFNGTELNEAYFKQVESNDVVIKSSDGKRYNFNKTLEKRINNVSTNLKKAEDENGFIGSTWSGIKNITGIGDSSDNVREQQEIEKKLLEQFNTTDQNRTKVFKELTGFDYTEENLEKFIKGEIKLKSEIALNGYKDGQAMAVDVGADIVSGVAAVGIYTAAVAAAPFTGGGSIAVGIAAAGASGAAIKTGMKAADAAAGGREYSLKDAAHDAATGTFSGVIAPVTGGLGGAVGKTVATKLGVQAVKQVGKEVAESAVESGVKQTIKTALTNPTGYEYVGGNIAKKSLALGAEMATDGAVGGSVDNAFRTAIDGGSLEDVAQAAGEGFVGGAILSPVIGGGMKSVGKISEHFSFKNNLEVPEKEKFLSNIENFDVSEKLKTANTREDFASIRDAIKNMPSGQDKAILQQEYIAKYNEWIKSSERPDIRMEYRANSLLNERIQNACIKDGIIDENLLKIANDLKVTSENVSKDVYLSESTDITIEGIIKLIKDLPQEQRQEVADSAKELFTNSHVRNGVVDMIISACIEENNSKPIKFNNAAFKEIINLFDMKNKTNPSTNDFSYSLKVAEIANSAIRYTYDSNGKLVKSFDEVNFNIAKLYSEFNKDALHIDFRYAKDKDTDLIDISKLDSKTQKYILENLPTNMQSNINKISEDIFNRDKIAKVFENMGFSEKENRNGIFAPVDLQEKVFDKMNFGRYGDIFFSEDDLDNISKMLNQGNHKDFWKKQTPEDLIVYCLRYKNLFSDFYTPPVIERMGDKFWDNVIKNLENSTPSEDELTALARYTGESSNQINAALTARQNNQNSNQIYLKYADDLAQLLDKHVLTEDIHVYMGSDYIEPLNTLKLKDGTSILDVIENPSKFKDRSKEIDALLNGFVVNQERFMSTSLVEENHSHRFAKVNYDFTLKAGSNALFRNIYTNVNNHEIEMIVQKDSKIIFKGIDWDTGKIIADVVTN